MDWFLYDKDLRYERVNTDINTDKFYHSAYGNGVLFTPSEK